MGIEWFDHDGNALTSEEWARKCAKDPQWVVVAKSKVGERHISTVLLGLDHGFGGGLPVIYETMTFPDQSIQERYCTRTEALIGHEKVVAQCRDELAQKDAIP